jgi:hypothetical protein
MKITPKCFSTFQGDLLTSLVAILWKVSNICSYFQNGNTKQRMYSDFSRKKKINETLISIRRPEQTHLPALIPKDHTVF